VADAFFVCDGERYAASELTRGPWDPNAQHAGPPTALLGRAVERAGSISEAQVARITFEILRPIPIATLTATAEVVRAGRTVELIEAVLSDEQGELVRARAWRVRSAEVDLSGGVLPDDPPPAGPGSARPAEAFFPTGHDTGYHTAMEVRFSAGEFLRLGPATAWMRMRYPLVAGEEPSPLARVLVAADSGNGISGTLDYRRYLFVNTDLTVNLIRPPVGQWVRLEAVTHPQPHGVGLADTALHDERGRIGRSTQTLVVSERA
jgi:hypothetical protein